MTPARTLAIALGAIVLTSCSAAWYVAAADREVAEILDRSQSDLDGERRTNLMQPGDAEAPPEPVSRDEPEGDASILRTMPQDDDDAIVVDLQTALKIGVTFNRDYKSRFESLYSQTLGYSLTRFDFGPQLNWTMSTLWTDAEGVEQKSQSHSSALTLSQLLPTGANFSIGPAFSSSRDESGGSRNFATSLSMSLNQPLLRGAGYEISHEAWTQAQRSLIYSVRSFELFRQQFSIDIARDYFDLLSERQTLANEEANYSQAVFDRRKAEGLYETDRQTEQEVFRAKRRELLAEDQLVNARANFDRTVEQFKITLGLPIGVPIVIADAEPEFVAIDIDASDAFEAARANRIDLRTQRQQIEDSERAVRIAKNAFLPDLDLSIDYGLADNAAEITDAGADAWSASAGLTMSIPLQQLPQRNSYKNALLALGQARRDYRQLLDQLEIDLANQVRQLKSIERSIELQQQLIEQERRAVTVSEIRFESGDLDNRDLLEARQALIDAQNALIRLKVNHFIGRLSLLRDLGLLFIDDAGMWQ